MITLVLGLLEISWATSMAFHLRRGSEIPWVTMRWKSAIPPASTRFRSASCCGRPARSPW